MTKNSFHSLSRRDALVGLAAAGAAAALPGDAFAQPKKGIVTWNVNNLKSIGGHPAFVLGTPKVMDTPAGKAVLFDGTGGLILETNPMEGYQQWTMETLVRPDGGKDTAQRIFHIGEINPATGQAVTITNPNNPTGDSNPRYTFELRSAGDQVWFESFNTGPGYQSALITAEKKHPLHTWLVITQTYDGTTHRHYVNGQLEMEKPLKYYVQGKGRCAIGTRLNRVTPFVGGYMRMRFADRALPPEEHMKVPAALKA
jgi:hypothetical protein